MAQLYTHNDKQQTKDKEFSLGHKNTNNSSKKNKLQKKHKTNLKKKQFLFFVQQKHFVKLKLPL